MMVVRSINQPISLSESVKTSQKYPSLESAEKPQSDALVIQILANACSVNCPRLEDIVNTVVDPIFKAFLI